MKKLWFCLLCIGLPIHGFSRVYTVDGISFEMVQVEGGRFLMGAQKDDATQANYNPKALFDEQPVHYVNLRDYLIGKYPVTQELWFAVTRQQPVADATHQWFSEAGYGIGYPAYYISYNDALAFIATLNDSLSASGQLQHGDFFRLPTEAEWEYAARGGKESRHYLFAGSNDINEVGWYASNSPTSTQVVGKKKPNELGLYDMSGNVLEWCSDYYGDYPEEEQDNPTGALFNKFDYRVCRGGCYPRQEHIAFVSSRLRETEYRRLNYIGLRIVLQHTPATDLHSSQTTAPVPSSRIILHDGKIHIEHLTPCGQKRLYTLLGQSHL